MSTQHAAHRGCALTSDERAALNSTVTTQFHGWDLEVYRGSATMQVLIGRIQALSPKGNDFRAIPEGGRPQHFSTAAAAQAYIERVAK